MMGSPIGGQVRLYLLGAGLADLEGSADGSDGRLTAGGQILGEDLAGLYLQRIRADGRIGYSGYGQVRVRYGVPGGGTVASDEFHQQFVGQDKRERRPPGDDRSGRSVADPMRHIGQDAGGAAPG